MLFAAATVAKASTGTSAVTMWTLVVAAFAGIGGPVVTAIGIAITRKSARDYNQVAREAAENAKAANKAVNGVAPGEPRLVEKVDTLLAQQGAIGGHVDRLDGQVQKMAQQIGYVAGRVSAMEKRAK